VKLCSLRNILRHVCTCTASKWRIGSIDSQTQIARERLDGARGTNVVIHAWNTRAQRTSDELASSFDISLKLAIVIRRMNNVQCVHMMHCFSDKASFFVPSLTFIETLSKSI
jgi:hypothetical protein